MIIPQIHKIGWQMRSVEFWLGSLRDKLADLEDMGVLDPFDPEEKLLEALGKIAEAAEDASAMCESAIEEAGD